MVNTQQALDGFLVDDPVRLLDQHGDVLPGSVGRILGKVPRSAGMTYVVCVIDEKCYVFEVSSNEIVPVDDFRVSAASA